MPGPNFATVPRPYIRTPDDAQGFWQLGNLWRVVATGHQTGGSLGFIDQLVTDKGGGPGVHMHNADEALYVVSGHSTFFAGGQELSVGPGGLVFLPRFTEHAFIVDAPGTQMLNFYVPAGIELYLIAFAHPAARNELPEKGEVPMPPPRLVEQISRDYGQFTAEGFPLPVLAPPTPDQFATRPNPGAAVQPFLASAESGKRYWHDGQLWSVLGDGPSTDNSLALFEVLAPAGTGSLPQVFVATDQFFFVLDGEVDFWFGDRVETARAGDFVFVPRGTPHADRAGAAGARFLTMATPSGWDRALYYVGEATDASEPPPDGWSKPAVNEKWRSHLLDAIGLRLLAVPDPFA